MYTYIKRERETERERKRKKDKGGRHCTALPTKTVFFCKRNPSMNVCVSHAILALDLALALAAPWQWQRG